jgi:hypothetical protein
LQAPQVWKGLVDAEKLIEHIYANRSISTRPCSSALTMCSLIDTDWVIHHLNGRSDMIQHLQALQPEGQG